MWSSDCSLYEHIPSKMTQSRTCVESVIDVSNQGLRMLYTNDIYEDWILLMTLHRTTFGKQYR